jgi:hypothetical protein
MSLNDTFIHTLNFVFTVAGLGIFTVGLALQLVSKNMIVVELLAGASGRNGVVSTRLWRLDEDALRADGFHELLLTVRASNIGRRTTDIMHWSVLTSKRWSYTVDEFHLNPKLPYRLEPGTAVNFYVPIEQIYAAVSATRVLRGLVTHVCASVSLGTGVVRRSKMHRLPWITIPEAHKEGLKKEKSA